ncbi:MAG: hypothetical protein WBE86_08210 [Candidatus Acidiferrales bacterium]
MNKPSVLAAIVVVTLFAGLAGCASKSDASAPQAGRFRIVSIESEQEKTTALLDSETGCMWEYQGPKTTEYYMADFEDVLTIGYYPDITMQSRVKLPVNGDAKVSAELKVEEGKNGTEQAGDCDEVRYRAVQDALGKKPSH